MSWCYLVFVKCGDERLRLESWKRHQSGTFFETEQHDAEHSVNVEERKHTN